METTKSAAPAAIKPAEMVSGPAFDWAVALLANWMMFGAYLDDWAHHEFELESFFTPWHAVLYSGFLLLAGLMTFTFLRNVSRGYPWAKAMPAGYGLSLVGVLVFFAGGFGDMVWHTLFGIEVGLEALLSPTHLLLAIGGALIGTGPLRAAWRRDSARPELSAILSMAGFLATLAFFTSFAHPLMEVIHVENSGYSGHSLAVASLLLQSGLFMGVILLAVRRWSLPFGSLALILGLPTLFAVTVHRNWVFLLPAVITGLAGDLLLAWLKPSPAKPGEFRWFALLLPAIFSSLYFATRALLGDLNWTIHLWAGTIFLAGIAGLLLSFAFLPPAFPDPSSQNT